MPDGVEEPSRPTLPLSRRQFLQLSASAAGVLAGGRVVPGMPFGNSAWRGSVVAQADGSHPLLVSATELQVRRTTE